MLQIDQKTYRNRQDGTIIVLTPTGRLDINTAGQFRLKLQECFSNLSQDVLVNLGQVNFIDSSGLSSLVEGVRDADKVNGSFRICNIHPEARVVFEVANLDGGFVIFDTEEEVLKDEIWLHIGQKTDRTSDDTTIMVLTPTGRLDINTAWKFRLKLQECISKLSHHTLVNLGQVNFIDSAGLTCLIESLRDAVKVKGCFRICNIQPEVRVVFEVTMMDTVFDIFDTEEEALESKVQAASGGGSVLVEWWYYPHRS